MTDQEHWIGRVARATGLPGAETLDVPSRSASGEAWDLVVRHCGVTREELARAIAHWFRLEVADPSTSESTAAKLLPGSVARKFNVFPLYESDRHLTVATADPSDPRAEQEVGFASGRIPDLQIAPPDVITELIEATYSPDKAVANLLDRIDPVGDASVLVIEEEEDAADSLPLDEEEGNEGPIIRLANMILEDAVSKGASDIHLQPLPSGGVIRLRIDGVLRSGINLPLAVLARVISRIKIMSRLDISDRMRPQDGRARVRIQGSTYDLRTSTVPVRNGEKAVIRILDPHKSGVMEESGIPEREVERLRSILRSRDGILVVTGPTGSGKTTTMYAALREIATEDVNIMTVEDPVEYELPGLTQIQVDEKQGIHFHTALRAILRQDPDVIFVGEIRDSATAQMAAQASLTGHLVLTTVHANDAVGSVRRFLDLGLDAGTISETLRGALAQRLLRLLCVECARPTAGKLTAEEKELATRFGTHPPLRAMGCEVCGHSGYQGRRPVVELLSPTPTLLRLVSQEATHIDLTLQAERDGMRTLLDGALDLVREGLTTLEEVERVIGEETLAASLPGGPDARTEPRGSHPSPPEEWRPPPGSPPPRLREEQRSLFAESPPDTGEPGTPAPPTGQEAAEAPKVLVVDDDGSTRLLVRAILESHGWTVLEAATGAEALVEIGRGRGLSLIVLDLGLPDLDGLDVLRTAKGSLDTAGTPVIVLTGRTDRDTERLLLREGAEDYIRKPIDATIFLTRSKAVMRRVQEF